MKKKTCPWDPTLKFRILRSSFKGITFKEEDRLQQMWKSWDGDTEWRNVEIVVLDRDTPEWKGE